jgi:hypothetical protein
MLNNISFLDSSSRQTRKRLAPFTNDSNDCSELLRKYSSLSSNQPIDTNYQQNYYLSNSQFEPSLSLSSTNLSIKKINNSTSPSTTSSSSSASSLSQSQVMLDGVPMKLVKSTVPVNLHSAQSCYIPNTQQYYQPYPQQQQQQQFVLPASPYSNLEYRQTFAASTTTCKLKSAPPPPYLYNRTAPNQSLNYSDEELMNRQLQNGSTSSAFIPPYVEYKKPPSYQESVQRNVSVTTSFFFF